MHLRFGEANELPVGFVAFDPLGETFVLVFISSNMDVAFVGANKQMLIEEVHTLS